MPGIENNPFHLVLSNIRSFDDSNINKKYIRVDLTRDTIDYVENRNERSTLKSVNQFVARHLEGITEDSEATKKMTLILDNARVRVINRQTTSFLDWVINFIYTLILFVTSNSKEKITAHTQFLIEMMDYQRKIRETIRTQINSFPLTTKMIKKSLYDQLLLDITPNEISNNIVKQFQKDADRRIEFTLTDGANSINSIQLAQNVPMQNGEPSLLTTKVKAILSILTKENDKKWNHPLQSLFSQTTPSTIIYPVSLIVNNTLSHSNHVIEQPKDSPIHAQVIRNKTNEITEIKFSYPYSMDCYSTHPMRKLALKNAISGTLSFSLKMNNESPFIDDVKSDIIY